MSSTKQKTGNYDFHEDLAIANQTEHEISDLLTQFNFKTLHFNDDNKYDLLLERGGKEYRLEIKEDFQCGDTGNVAVEYESRGKLSGVFTSQSDLYMYRMHFTEAQGGVKHYLMTKKNLIAIIKDRQYVTRVNGGDYGSNTMMYLFRAKALEAISTVI